MATATWVQTAAVAAHTAYAIPAGSGLAPDAMLTDVLSVCIAPLATAGAASIVSPTRETRTAPNTAAPAAGAVSLQTVGANAQQLISGDAIPADSLMIAVVATQNETVIQ